MHHFLNMVGLYTFWLLLCWAGLICLDHNFIDPNDIKQTGPTKLPAQITATFPPSCKHLSVEYKCSGKDNTSVEPSDMKPFTDYSCTGLIKNNSVFINKTTAPVHFNIHCDFSIYRLWSSSTTNTSFKLNWETMSDKCQDVLHKLEKLSYSCSCQDVDRTEGKTSKQPDGGTCDITGLKPFNEYRCNVRPIYDDRNYFDQGTATVKTKPGIPDIPTRVKIADPSENNAVRVTCGPPSDFNGPDRKFVATLFNAAGSIQEKKNEQRCDFEFKDLDYSTSYRVEIVTFNGHFMSVPVRIQVASRYNYKARFGVLIFLLLLLILFTAITEIVAFIIRRRASRRNKPDYQHHDKEAH